MSCWNILHDDLTIMDIALLIENINKYHGKNLRDYNFEWKDSEKIIISSSDVLGSFIDEPITHIYLGNEFCEYKLPTNVQLRSLMTLCQKENLNPVLVTPPVTDYGINKISLLLDEIDNNSFSVELIVNDVGVLQLIHDRQINCSVTLGRVFDKMSHDSRASVQQFDTYYGSTGKKFAASPGIISKQSKKKFISYNVTRYEFDLPKVGIRLPCNGERYSLYWPFSYLTTGRVCFFRSIAQKGRNKFLVGSDPCIMPCRELQMLKAKGLHPDSEHYLFQHGNTIFFVNDRREGEKYFDMFDRIVLQL